MLKNDTILTKFCKSSVCKFCYAAINIYLRIAIIRGADILLIPGLENELMQCKNYFVAFPKITDKRNCCQRNASGKSLCF